MNSSTRISPTLAGLRFVVNTAHLTFGTDFVGWAEERSDVPTIYIYPRSHCLMVGTLRFAHPTAAE